VRMGHEGRSAGHRHQGGAGSRTRCSGPGPILEPPRTMERPGRSLSTRGRGQMPEAIWTANEPTCSRHSLGTMPRLSPGGIAP
jgi:hypothetical protein